MKDCILLRYGEIGLKSKKTRAHFEIAYIKSIKDALRRNYFSDLKIDNLGGRFVVYCEPEAVSILERVAGIQSLSPAKQFMFKSKTDLLKQVEKIGSSLVKGKTFAVKIKRIGKHEFNSLDLAKEAGSVLYDYSKGVDLTTPEVKIFLEIRDKECFFYTSIIDGVGGMPLNKNDKVLCLFSGGIDSPVAAFQMIKRGCNVDFLFVNLVGEEVLSDVSKIYNFLITKYAFGYSPKIFVIDAKPLVTKLKSKVPDSLRQIALKIVLYKIGEQIADKNGHLFLSGGESLSQKSSQTLKSLLFIGKQVFIPMLRPLLTLDKIEIIKIAQKLGTMSMSEKIKEFCNLSEGPVTTTPREEDIEKIPSFEKEIKDAVSKVSVTRGVLLVDELKPVKLSKNVISVDIRELVVQKKNPLKTKLSVPYTEIFSRVNEFKKDSSYLFVCEFGVRSESVASELRNKGVKAAGISISNYLKYFKK
ncbi:MAG: THUMP domain-containing protein [archaeon]